MTEKLFYGDSHMREFTAVVTACEKQDGFLAVELDRTVFFPEGGGQYADTGMLGSRKVSDVQEKGGHIFHMIPTEKNGDEIPEEFLPGSPVKGVIDWDERFMKMQQHTGEHIVSGIVHERFGYNNVGFHLGSTDCTMDFNGEITKEELSEIEAEANRAVWKNLEIQVLYPSKEELEQIEYRSKIEIEGQVRIVVVPGYDTCACCAPHVKYTGEIGLIKLTGVQRYKGGVRVTMLCGVRALADYSLKQRQAQAVSAMLCAKENEIEDAVERLKEENTGLKAQLLEKEKAAVRLRADMVSPTEEVVCIFTDEFVGETARLLMNRILEQGEGHKICAVFSGNDADGYKYVMGSRVMDVRGVSKEMNAAFDGRGGGKPEMVQGTIKGKEDQMREWISEKAGNA